VTGTMLYLNSTPGAI